MQEIQKYVCNKCGKPREKMFEQKIDVGIEDSDTKYDGFNAGNLAKKRQAYRALGFESLSLPEFTGYSDCNCGAEFSGGIALDPFAGSGTVPLVALRNGMRFIGIELNPDYVKMAYKRIDEPLHTKGLSSFAKPKGLADFVKKNA